MIMFLGIAVLAGVLNTLWIDADLVGVAIAYAIAGLLCGLVAGVFTC
jgi:hypothetical protein